MKAKKMKVKEVVKLIIQVEDKLDIKNVDEPGKKVLYSGTKENIPEWLKEKDVYGIIALPGENQFPYIRIFVEDEM